MIHFAFVLTPIRLSVWRTFSCESAQETLSEMIVSARSISSSETIRGGSNRRVAGPVAFVTNPWIALAFTPITALGAVVTPALQGKMSKIARDDQQGELQGVISSARSVAQIFSPLAMTQIFFLFTAGSGIYLPGAPFLLSASLMILCMAVFLTIRTAQPKPT